jgi:general secretion pathway protein G
MARASKNGSASSGFSLMEMLLVLAIIGALAAVAAPAVNGAITRAKEAALRQNLSIMRKLIDDFAADRGEFPEALQVLVDESYLRAVPADPTMPGEPRWNEIAAKEGGISDVKSHSREIGLNGVPYADW